MAKTFPISDVPRELKAKYGKTVSYRKVYNGVIDGRLPAKRGDNGRWLMAEADLPAIAEALGLTDSVAA